MATFEEYHKEKVRLQRVEDELEVQDYLKQIKEATTDEQLYDVLIDLKQTYYGRGRDDGESDILSRINISEH
ncbi:MAG: hypothetical protein WC444_05775 [Candidatus Paceibacterota bacterium]